MSREDDLVAIGWTCAGCGADNTPEHCIGEADLGVDGEDPRCDIDHGYCVCGCGDCNPQTCRECGDDL